MSPLPHFTAAFALGAMLSITAPAQTLGLPGINDFSLNGQGSGTISNCTRFRLLTEAGANFALSFRVSAPAGTLIVPLQGICNPGTLPVGSNLYTLDVSPYEVALDPLATSGGVPLSIFLTVPPAGVWQLSVGFGATDTNFTFQNALLSAAYPAGAAMSQALSAEIRVINPVCGGVSVEDPSIGGTLSDDGSVQLALTPSSFTFYGTSYSTLWINMNGNLTFLGPDADFTPDVTTFLSGLPRLAPAWADFSPNDPSQGQVLVRQLATNVDIEWLNVRRFGPLCSGGADTNTFCARLDLTNGDVTFLYGRMDLCGGPLGITDGPLVGIGPGNNLSGPGGVDLSVGPQQSAGALGALFEDFTLATAAGFDLTTPASATPTFLLFQPLGGPGNGPYRIP